MLLNVLDQCLSVALSTAERQPIVLPRTRATVARIHRHSHLSSYPRLRQAIEKAEEEGVFRRRAF